MLHFAALADSFLPGTEDVPVMQGLQISEDETVSFDNEDGRLFFSKAYTKVAPSKVRAFYAATLPQLGWQEKDKGTFEREGDILRIGVVDGDVEAMGRTSVLFELITKSK